MSPVLLTISVLGVELLSPLSLAILLPLLYVLYTLWLHRSSSRANPLVWSWVPHLRSALLFGQDPNAFLAQCRDRYGPVFTLNLGGKMMTFVTDPAAFPLITRSRAGLSFTAVAAGVGQTVLSQSKDFSDDQELDQQIHALYPKHLAGAGLDELTTRFQQNLNQWLRTNMQTEAAARSGSGSGSGAAVQCGLLDLCTRPIFSASTRALFGDLLVDDGNANPAKFDQNFSDDFQQPKKLLGAFQKFDEVFPLLYGGVPQFVIRAGVEARDSMIEMLKSLRRDTSSFIRERRELIVENNPTPRPATDNNDFAASTLGLLWALHANTIPACFWTVFYLLRQPESMRRVRDEVRAVVAAEGGADGEIGREALKKMTLLDAAISEALRLATGSMMLRRATQDITLELPSGPLPLKRDANICIYPYLTHHDPSIYADPEEFKLDRFATTPVESSTVTDVQGRKVPCGFLPFGAGISLCPGRHFARNEIKLFLVTLLDLVDLEPTVAPADLKHPGHLLSRAGLGIFPPAHDIQVRYTPKL